LAVQLHALHEDAPPLPSAAASRTTTTSSTKRSRSSSKQQQKLQRKVNVAKVDGDAERALSSRFGVAGFPSFYLVDGWTVREFTGNRSKENLLKFALQGEEEERYDEEEETTMGETIPFLFGPFGPMGQLKSYLMKIGLWLIGLYENLTVNRGMKPLMAMSVMCVGGLVLGLVLITVLGLMLLPKVKLD
jgi:hypothetical protein